MGTRLQFQSFLEELVGMGKVYYQPPENVKLQYPCIIYSRVNGQTQYADDIPYNYPRRYQVMIIDKNPDSKISEKIETLPTCVFERHYTKDNLNHNIYNIYY